MNKYAYQIQGALEDAHGRFMGLRVLVCNAQYFEIVDVPVEIMDNETAKYIQFRLKLTTGALDIKRLPYKVQNAIRTPLGRWLDHWVLKNFYGDNRDNQSTNP